MAKNLGSNLRSIKKIRTICKN